MRFGHDRRGDGRARPAGNAVAGPTRPGQNSVNSYVHGHASCTPGGAHPGTSGSPLGRTRCSVLMLGPSHNGRLVPSAARITLVRARALWNYPISTQIASSDYWREPPCIRAGPWFRGHVDDH